MSEKKVRTTLLHIMDYIQVNADKLAVKRATSDWTHIENEWFG